VQEVERHSRVLFDPGGDEGYSVFLCSRLLCALVSLCVVILRSRGCVVVIIQM